MSNEAKRPKIIIQPAESLCEGDAIEMAARVERWQADGGVLILPAGVTLYQEIDGRIVPVTGAGLHLHLSGGTATLEKCGEDVIFQYEGDAITPDNADEIRRSFYEAMSDRRGEILPKNHAIPTITNLRTGETRAMTLAIKDEDGYWVKGASGPAIV